MGKITNEVIVERLDNFKDSFENFKLSCSKNFDEIKKDNKDLRCQVKKNTAFKNKLIGGMKIIGILMTGGFFAFIIKLLLF